MNKKKHLVVLLLAFVIVAVLSTAGDTYAASGSYRFSEENSDNTYGYDYFGKMSNGEKLQAMYRELDTAAKSFHNDSSKNADSDNVAAVISYAQYGLTLDEALSVWQIYKLDHPLYYWISYSVDYTADSIRLKVVPEYKSGVARVSENKAIEGKLQEYLNLLEGETDPYVIAWMLQREIDLAAEYKRDEYGQPSNEEYCHNIVGILDNKGTVCEGYSKLFSLLLNECGIDNVIVIGESGGESHSWNMVKLKNGNWYNCDLTWDDYSIMLYDTGSFERFMKGSAFFADHTAYSEEGNGLEFLYGLPYAPESDYIPDIRLGKTFKVGKDRYSISGYKEVTLYKTTRTGNVTIPETVKYNGVTYKVVALGKDDYWKTLVEGKVKTISIPKTVRMIWQNVLMDSGIKSISVDSNNKYYRSRQGILYTKSYYTLVMYPGAKKISRLVLPKNTHIIAYGAFCTKNTGAIGELVINANLEAVGLANWGIGPIDKKPPASWIPAFVTGEWGNIGSACRKITISKSNKYYRIKNNCVLTKGSNSYSDGKVTVSVAGDIVLAAASCNVKSVTIPASAVVISVNAFYRLPNLKTVKFNKKLKAIEQGAFSGDEKLVNVRLPEGLLYMGDCVFSRGYRGSQKKYQFHLYIPKSVKLIDGAICGGNPETVVIHGVKNSYAHKYAKKTGHNFTTKKLKTK